MPYIKPERRQELRKLIKPFTSAELTSGELNFVFSRILWGAFNYKRSYEVANTLIGVLENVKLEFYRRQVGPYEDDKMIENGDLDLSA